MAKADYNAGKVQTDSSEPTQLHSRTSWTQIPGRKPANSSPVLIPNISDACVLVTGAGGFIGSEMVRVLAQSGARKIVLLDICEQHLFEISTETAARGCGCVSVLGSVCDRRLLAALFDEHRPELVIHAAALKHVALMEHNPLAAVQTNALGTWYVAQTAEECGARHMILVSTDKAVAPHSIMGAAKRIAELAMLAPSHLRKTAVRLVNVFGSPCSVAPLFAEQIARGGPVTVTHPAAQRYFLTLGEVTGLLAEIIDAESTGLLVPEPGEPLRIGELARRMIAASARDISIVFTEPRPGEKLDERLLSPAEQYDGRATCGLRHVFSPAVDSLDRLLGALACAVDAGDGSLVLRLVREIVPDYQPSPVLQNAIAEVMPQSALTRL